jgi:hypothetical protein
MEDYKFITNLVPGYFKICGFPDSQINSEDKTKQTKNKQKNPS